MFGIAVAMTKPIVFRKSGKVEGIKGLYKSPATGRLYVRYSYHGVDRQTTIFPKKMTFSDLERSAASALSKLQREVKSEFSHVENAETTQHMNAVEFGCKKLESLIIQEWAMRQTSQNHTKRLLRCTSDMAICDCRKQSTRKQIDDHNIHVLRDRLRDAETMSKKRAIYDSVMIVFKYAIESGNHCGSLPTHFVSRPKHTVARRSGTLTPSTIHAVYKDLIENSGTHETFFEYALFFRMCIETGQRPRDIFLFDVRKLKDGRYLFWNHKTSRNQRVAHKLSDQTIKMIGELIIRRGGISLYSHSENNCFCETESFDSLWKNQLKTYEDFLSKKISQYSDGNATLYNARSFFVTSIFDATNSDIWASAFTHEGNNVNQKHYLKLSQEKADEILTDYLDRMQNVFDGNFCDESNS